MCVCGRCSLYTTRRDAFPPLCHSYERHTPAQPPHSRCIRANPHMRPTHAATHTPTTAAQHPGPLQGLPTRPRAVPCGPDAPSVWARRPQRLVERLCSPTHLHNSVHTKIISHGGRNFDKDRQKSF